MSQLESEATPLVVGTRIAIVRHGEAYCNAESFIGGHIGCRGLTEKGFRQAEVLANRLRQTQEFGKAVALYTSILPRAVQTSEIIMSALNLTSFEQRCELCERHPGVADGITWAEYEERYKRPSLPGDVPDLPLSEGGESWIEFLDRAKTSLRAVAAAHPGELSIVVAHGGIIDSSMIRFLDLPEHGAGVRLHPEHTSITEWEWVGSRWRLVRYNDAAHLVGPEAAHLHSEAPEWVHEDRVDVGRRGA